MKIENILKLGAAVGLFCFMQIASAVPPVNPLTDALTSANVTIRSNTSRIPAFNPTFNTFGIAFKVVEPTDPLTGLPTGRKLPAPLTVTKLLDEDASLFLLNSLANNEILTTVEIDFVKSNFQIILSNARVISYGAHPQGTAFPGTVTSTFTELVDVTFAYDKIVMYSKDSGYKGEIDFSTKVP